MAFKRLPRKRECFILLAASSNADLILSIEETMVGEIKKPSV